MKHLILYLILVFAFTTANGQQTYSFRNERPQGLSIEHSDSQYLSLHYSIGKIVLADIDNGEAKGQEIVLSGCFGSFAEGLPNLPTENRYIAVPHGATVKVEAKKRASRILDDIDLLPAAQVQPNAAVGLPALNKNKAVFEQDADFPAENAEIIQTTQIRGLDVALLKVTPFRYNPVRKTLEVIHEMDIEVRFEGGDGQFGDSRYRNPAWDNILHDLVINSELLPEAHYYERLNEAIQNREEGCEYLIIAPDDDSIVAWADTLKDFRNRQGILTKVVTTTECGGNTAEQIKGYIQNAYNNWAIPPAAITIFNSLMDTMTSSWPPPEQYTEGTTGIPAFPLVFLNYNNEGKNYNYKSDNPYSDMNGDSIPDIALSRIPAMSLEEYQMQVRKLIQYETNPPTDPNYYDQPIITSGYEDNKWFLMTSQSVNGFYQNKLGKHPRNFYMLYEYTVTDRPDSLWSTGYNTDAVVDYFGPDGQNYFPRYPNALNDWRSMKDNSYFTEALNSGSFLTLYRDHSAVDWWCCPEFHYYEIANLNHTEPTFIISIGCHTAKFTDTYYNSGWSPHFREPSILNTFCRNSVGAVGGIGAVTVTHSHYNDILTWGFIDYIWPDFMPSLGSHTTPDFVRPVYGLVASKLFLNQHAFLPDWWPIKITTTHNVFHYLGEAYLNLYTETPQPLTLEAPLQHPNAQWYYRFTAEQGATACFSKDNEIIQVFPATGQPQTVLLPQMAVGEQFTITATKQNRFRLEQTVTVTFSGHATVEWNNLDFDLYPNPTDGRINLVANEALQGQVSIELFSPLGERVINQTYRNVTPGETLSIDLQHYAAGLFILIINTEKGCISKKVSLKKSRFHL